MIGIRGRRISRLRRRSRMRCGKGSLAAGDELPSVKAGPGLGPQPACSPPCVPGAEPGRRRYAEIGTPRDVRPLRNKPATKADIETRVAARIRDLVTDAFHLGLSADEFRELVDDVIRRQNRRKISP